MDNSKRFYIEFNNDGPVQATPLKGLDHAIELRRQSGNERYTIVNAENKEEAIEKINKALNM